MICGKPFGPSYSGSGGGSPLAAFGGASVLWGLVCQGLFPVVVILGKYGAARFP